MSVIVLNPRVSILKRLALLAFSGFILGFAWPGNGPQTRETVTAAGNDTVKDFKKIKKSDEEWKAQLSDHEFYILRRAGTERPFTGSLLKNKAKGTYHCRGCGLALFKSDHKFNSGTGWPSFYDKAHRHNVVTQADNKFGMVRTEILCGRCDGHLGHVFTDGPDPTGLRYCVNSASLQFKTSDTQQSKRTSDK
ncbi:MAG: peptide-methionine (R)-S-oxide reductase MsrB [Myxococcota bacterium]|nr:peptide-methionine (R)-S-oxide reductase MsrB [Myxococcota bacterium]